MRRPGLSEPSASRARRRAIDAAWRSDQAGVMDAMPAASLILLREGAGAPDDPPEYLIVQRSRALRFAGGAFAFPGGRVDPADRALAESFDGDADDMAARIACLRELREETGLDFGESGLTADDLAQLVPFARWCPPDSLEARRFDTRFYLARARADTAMKADGSEIVHAFWSTARATIERHQAGEGRMLFPTRCLLERLAGFATFAEAGAEAEEMPPVLIQPAIRQIGGARWLTIPENAGYSFTRQLLGDADRS